MSKQSQAFFKGQKMTHEEIKEYFKKKAGTRKGSFDLETERLLKEIETFEAQWWNTTINKFLDGKEGKKFLEDHEGENPDEVFEILLKQSNIGTLFNKALSKKIDELRGG
ncbi:hypothetical protein ES703_19058 [subsurface metagenome]